jgi:hypothetical protein
MEYAQLSPGRGFSPVKTGLYYLQRLATPLPLRKILVRMISACIARVHGKFGSKSLCSSHVSALKILRDDGFAPLGSVLTPSQCEEIHAFLRHKPLCDRDTGLSVQNLEHRPATLRVADYALEDLVCCPHVLELANSRTLLSLASDYLGCKPTISAIGLRWSFPQDGAHSALQKFHRDSEDWKYFKIMVYLTAVERGDGAHIFIRKTHLEQAPVFLRYIDDEALYATVDKERVVVVDGLPGYGFAVDTSGVHKGSAPCSTPRLMLQIQYSLLPCYAYAYRPIAHPAYLDFDRYTNRLILRRKQKRQRIRYS